MGFLTEEKIISQRKAGEASGGRALRTVLFKHVSMCRLRPKGLRAGKDCLLCLIFLQGYHNGFGRLKYLLQRAIKGHEWAGPRLVYEETLSHV